MRCSARFLFVSCLALTACPFEARAANLGEVTVQAPSDDPQGVIRPEARRDSSAFTSVITSEELKGRRTNLPEVLQKEAGIQIKRYGGLDDFATISIRGSTSEQVTIYLDGILLNQGVGRGVDVSRIPSEQIERIEVYKGAAPAWFGTSAMGGVVNIVTKKATAKRTTQATSSYGSFNTFEGNLLQAQDLKQFAYTVGYTFSRSDGDFSYLDNNGTPFNTSDDREVSRINNEFARHNLLTKVRYRFLNIQNQFFHEERGIPGLGTLTSKTASLKTTRNALAFDVTKEKAFNAIDLTLSPYFQYNNEQFSDPQGETGLGARQNDDHTFQYGSNLRNNFLVGSHQKWNLNLGYRGEQFLPEDLTNASAEPSSVRNTASFAVEDEIFLGNEKIILNPSVRTEHIFNDFANASTSALHPVSGKIGIKYSPVQRLTFKTNVARSYRIPNFVELFGDRGTLVGNSRLSPEKGIIWDIGVIVDFSKPQRGGEGALPAPRIQVSYFLNHVDDLIQFLQTSQHTIRAENLSSARLQGIEASVATSFLEHLDLSANYTFQWAEDISGLPGVDGKFLPGRPLHEVNAKGTLRHRWGKLYSEMSFIDSNYLDTQNVLRVDNRVLLGAGVSASFLKRFTANFEAKNLLNDRVSDVVGFPLPGRSYYGKIEINI